MCSFGQLIAHKEIIKDIEKDSKTGGMEMLSYKEPFKRVGLFTGPEFYTRTNFKISA